MIGSSFYYRNGVRMNWVNLADLDELVLLCKDVDAKKYILEAVNCYKSGAFRAAIVLTWIATLYDVVGKLRQLTLLGDNKAKQYFEEFEKYRENSDFNNSMKFEKRVLSIAKEFEFITELEHAELERLSDDRNRCAHPSMNSSEQVYSPTAELARYHLRNAVLYLIQYLPVQGKAALSRLELDVKSPLFPTDKQRALDWFQGTALISARDALVRNFGLVLLKYLVINASGHHEAMQYAAALNAVREMYISEIESLFKQKLGHMVDSVEETDLKRVIRFISLVPNTWHFLSNRAHILLKNYIVDLGALTASEEIVEIFAFALDAPELKNEVVSVTSNLYQVWQMQLIQAKPIREFVHLVVKAYENAGSYASAREVGKSILSLLQFFSEEEIHRIVAIAVENDQVFYSLGEGGIVDVLNHIKKAKNLSNEKFKELLEPLLKVKENYWIGNFPELFII